MKETAERAEAAVETAAPAVEAGAPLALTQADRILALQRTAGNRAVARMVADGAMVARSDTTTVKKFVKEETTGADNVTWWAEFDVTFDDDASPATCWLTIKIRLSPDDDVSTDEVEATKSRASLRFSALWDSLFVLHEHRMILSNRNWLLRPRLEFVSSGQHLTVHLHKGKGADNRQNWYLDSPAQTYAHEVSHQMGLLDEYADVSVPGRKVYTDNSIMGDYYNEGIAKAEGRLRHGQRLAALIAEKTGKELTVIEQLRKRLS